VRFDEVEHRLEAAQQACGVWRRWHGERLAARSGACLIANAHVAGLGGSFAPHPVTDRSVRRA
jgi:hypothetical protein